MASLRIHETPISFFDGLARLFRPRPSPRRNRFIDIREMPDHVRRDIGIMDGNDPTGRGR